MRAGVEKRWGIDVNGQPTKDLVVVGKHWPEPFHKGDEFTHWWNGGAWGEGKAVPDPRRGLMIYERVWEDVACLTDSTGTRRIRTVAEHAALGVEVGVRISVEPKGSYLFDTPPIWEKLGAEYDAIGHPRFAMTLSDIGSPLRRVRAAHAVTPPFQIAVLPRGERRQDLVDEADAVWGTQWGTL